MLCGVEHPWKTCSSVPKAGNAGAPAPLALTAGLTPAPSSTKTSHYVVSSFTSGRRRFIACPLDRADYVYVRSRRLRGQWNSSLASVWLTPVPV